MATKRPRKIHVDGKDYLWRVSLVDASFVRLRLWREGNRQPWADTVVPFHNPWSYGLYFHRDGPGNVPVMPGRVAILIRLFEAEALEGEVIWDEIKEKVWSAESIRKREARMEFVRSSAELAHELLHELHARDPENVSFSQVGILDGREEVLDLLKYNELGCALDHLLYMVEESEIVFPADRLRALREMESSFERMRAHGQA